VTFIGGGGTGGGAAPIDAPTTMIPAASTTIYSDAAATAGFNPFPNWGQTTQYSEVTIAGNKSLKDTNLNCEGIEFTAVDVSAKGKIHFDFWSPDLTSVKVSIISAGRENAVTQALTTGSWNSVDIDLSNYRRRRSPHQRVGKLPEHRGESQLLRANAMRMSDAIPRGRPIMMAGRAARVAAGCIVLLGSAGLTLAATPDVATR
jgi:hypothetical protein